jgi:diguanylate cyclase (GGDEF)-like protein/PAS domain S-box-containing protein
VAAKGEAMSIAEEPDNPDQAAIAQPTPGCADSYRRHYETLFEQMPDSVIITDQQLRIIGFNLEALRQYEYTADEIVRLSIPDFEAQEDPQEVARHAARIAATGRDDFTSRHRTRSGRVVDVWVSVRIVEVADGSRIFQCVFRDISAQKQLERQLQESEERLALALDNAGEGMWDWDLASGRLLTSSQWQTMLGYAPGEISDIDAWRAICHPDDLPEAGRRLEAHFSGNTPHYEFEHRLRHKLGHWVWVLGKAKVVSRNAAGQPIRVVGTNVNIDAFKRTEQALQREIVKNDVLFRTAADGLHILDGEGRLLQANSAFCNMLGYSQTEIRGMNVTQWDCHLPGGFVPRDFIAELPVEGVVLETRHRRKNGSEFEVEVSITKVVIHGETLVYAAARDISLRKHNERLLKEREAHLNALVNSMPHLVWLKDRDSRYLAGNVQLARASGLDTAADVIGKTDFDIWPSELARRYQAEDRQVMDSRNLYFSEEREQHGERVIHWETFKTPIIDANGEVLGTAGYALDISERKRQEESLALAASIYQLSGEAIVVTDVDNLIIDVNPAFTRITGYRLDEVRGKNPGVLKSGRHGTDFYQEMWHSLLTRGHWQGEIWDRRKNGAVYAKWANISVIRGPDDSIQRYVAQFSDITEKKLKDDLIWTQANYDTLTGLPNRRLLRDRLEQEILKTQRSQQNIALLFIDLDRFKEVNDTLGHALGDELLVEAARRISGCVRESDTVARLGGDEFTVILPGISDNPHADKVAQSILQTLATPFALGSESVYITASIGITLYPEDAGEPEELLKQADQAMYVAKSNGRNRFSHFTASMQAAANARLALTNDLRRALVQDELLLHYQPIIDLATGCIVKAEALLRWQHAGRGLIAPGTFIPLAEETGLILEIGSQVFRQVLDTLTRWQQRYGLTIPIGINKSPLQFASGHNDWTRRLIELELPGDSIVIEITEGLLLNDSSEIRHRLYELRDLGVEIAIDDFGTGFSSLAYLKKFHIDYLKIDRSFIASLPDNSNDLALVEAIIVMARKLGIKTVAEGVETITQRDQLIACGCDYAQGYLFSHPLPLHEFERLLEKSLR